jgi:outer membrane beta-barrel protein
MRTTLLLALLLCGGASRSAEPVDTQGRTKAAATAPASRSDAADDEDDEAPPAQKAETPAAAAPGRSEVMPKPTVAQEGEGGSTPKQEEVRSDLRLVSGAPLFNPNVAVHIVERKQFADSGRRELTLYPISAQLNGNFTQHYGTVGSFVWHIHENFGLMLTGGYNWFNEESAFNRELVEKTSLSAEAAPSLLQTWSALGGVEVTPFYGKFAWLEGTLAHFGLFISGGAGVGGTRHLLKAPTLRANNTISPATYGDTGTRFLGTVGAGFRLQVGSRFSVRIEVRDVVYTARVERVNGCDFADLQVMDAANKAGEDPLKSRGSLPTRCDVSSFDWTVDKQTGSRRSDNLTFAKDLVKVPTSDVLNNVGVYLGASFLF